VLLEIVSTNVGGPQTKSCLIGNLLFFPLRSKSNHTDCHNRLFFHQSSVLMNFLPSILTKFFFSELYRFCGLFCKNEFIVSNFFVFSHVLPKIAPYEKLGGGGV